MADPASDFGAGLASDATNTAKTAINSFDPTDVGQKQQQNVSSLGSLLSGQTNDYIKRYAQTVAGNPTVTQLRTEANNMFGVPQQAAQVAQTENRVTNAIPDAYRGSRGFDISDTAVQNGIAAKTAYLTPQLNAERNNLNTSQSLASDYVTAGQEQNAQNLLPIQAEQQNLLQMQAAEATGWNQASQQEFEALIAKMQAGVTLSQQEMERANQLAAMETSYQNALTSATASQNAAKIGASNVIVPQGSTYLNTATGQAYNPYTKVLGQTIGR